MVNSPMPQPDQRWSHRLASWMMDHRLITSLIVLIPTVILALGIPQIEVYSRFADLLPQQHEYIKNYNRMKDTFGGANIVTLSLEVEDGDIFTNKTLGKIRRITDELDQIPGVNHYQVASIAHQKIRRVHTTASGLIKSDPVLPRDIPQDENALKRLREEIFNNDIVYGTYVSSGGEAALIRAGFDEERLDYSVIFSRLQQLKAEAEADGGVRLYIAGEPMLKGWIYHYNDQLKIIFGVTLIIIVAQLYIRFRSITEMIIPLIGTGLSAVWGLGFVGLAGYNLDPLILVVPILISARTASHCVQMLERYHEELLLGKTREVAVRTSMGELMIPAGVGILADAAGLLVLTVSSIPIIGKLGVFCSFWAMSNLFTVVFLVPLLLSILPVPNLEMAATREKHLTSRFMSLWARFIITPRATGIVLTGVLGVMIVSAFLARNLVVGEEKPGSPILFADSEYNIAASRINERFAGANQLSIYFEGNKNHRMKDPEVIETMQAFARHMSSVANFGGTRDIPSLVRSVNRLYHFDDPRWSVVPPTQRNIGNILFMYEAGAAVPGVILEYMDMEGRTANFVVFFKDATGNTVNAAITAAQEFLQAHPLEGVEYRFAGGIIGTTAAANQEVEHSELVTTILIMVAITLLVMATYRSISAGLLILAVLVLAVLVNRAYMGFRGIGLNVNTLPVTAVGLGIGVDYAVYVLDRIREEARRLDIEGAIHRTMKTTGFAVVFTALTVVSGIVYWIFGSALRFNSEMALLLSLLMVSNMVGAISLLPVLVRIFKPRFISSVGGHETNGSGGSYLS